MGLGQGLAAGEGTSIARVFWAGGGVPLVNDRVRAKVAEETKTPSP